MFACLANPDGQIPDPRSRAASWRRGGRSFRLQPCVVVLLVLFQPMGQEQNQPILKTISECPAGLTFPFSGF